MISAVSPWNILVFSSETFYQVAYLCHAGVKWSIQCETILLFLNGPFSKAEVFGGGDCNLSHSRINVDSVFHLKRILKPTTTLFFILYRENLSNTCCTSTLILLKIYCAKNEHLGICSACGSCCCHQIKLFPFFCI